MSMNVNYISISKYRSFNLNRHRYTNFVYEVPPFRRITVRRLMENKSQQRSKYFTCISIFSQFFNKYTIDE